MSKLHTKIKIISVIIVSFLFISMNAIASKQKEEAVYEQSHEDSATNLQQKGSNFRSMEEPIIDSGAAESPAFVVSKSKSNVNYRKEYDSCVKGYNLLLNDNKVLTKQLNDYKRKLKNYRSKSSGSSTQSLSNFKDKLDRDSTEPVRGRSSRPGSGDKADVISIEFPNSPKRYSVLESFLLQHHSELFYTLELAFNESEMIEFQNLEHDTCQDGNIYCQIDFRRKAIYYMLGGQ